MSEREKDRWRMREIERILVRQLHAAAEDYRLATQRLRDAAGPIPSGAQFPDSRVETDQALAACGRAHQDWARAIERWVEFVKYGTIPDDIAT